MKLKDVVLDLQMRAIDDADIGSNVCKSLETHRYLWSMVYFGGYTLMVFPMPGKEDELARLFRWSPDDESEGIEIRPDEVSWEEAEGKKYLRAWWD